MMTRLGAPQVGQRATCGGGGAVRWRLVIAGVGLHDHQAYGMGRDGTAGMEKAEMSDLHEAIG
jgi:hypothetical protein